ncbi:MAG: ArnT family glycosyltransferase [Candidatus Woesearchaeota archaeon]
MRKKSASGITSIGELMEHSFWSKWFYIIIAGILFCSLLLRLVFISSAGGVFFDSGVYLANGKFIFSGGESGFYEEIRPPVTSVIAGFLWWIGIDVPFGFFILLTVLSLLSIFLMSVVARFLYNSVIGIITALIFASTTTFFSLNYVMLSEGIALFFFMLSLYLLLKEYHFLAGISIAFAFFTKFYYGIFFVIFLALLIAYYFWWEESLKNWPYIVLFTSGIMLMVVPFLFLNAVLYANPLHSLQKANYVSDNAVYCPIIDSQPWYFYGIVFLQDSFLLLLALGGLLIACFGMYRLVYTHFTKKHNKKDIVLKKYVSLISLTILAGIPLMYLTLLSCKTHRYGLLVLPLLILLVGGTLYFFKKNSSVLFFFVSISAIFFIMNPLINHVPQGYQLPFAASYYEYASLIPQTETIVTNNAFLSFYTDASLIPAYYPLYNSQRIAELIEMVESQNYRYFFIDTCQGDLFCHPLDATCSLKTEQFIGSLANYYELTYIEDEHCWYGFFELIRE